MPLESRISALEVGMVGSRKRQTPYRLFYSKALKNLNPYSLFRAWLEYAALRFLMNSSAVFILELRLAAGP